VREIIVVQQVPDGEGLRKFRRPSEPAFFFVRCGQQLIANPSKGFGIKRIGSLSGRARGLFSRSDAKHPRSGDMMGKAAGLLFDLFFLLPEGLGDSGQQFLPGRAVIKRARRKIGAAIERPAFGGKEDIQWPAAAAGDGLHGIHIDMVQIGPFLPVDLDIDKMLVHEAGRIGIFETLPLHHMAPVTGCIADTHENGLILLLRLLQRFFSPGVPIHGIMCML